MLSQDVILYMHIAVLGWLSSSVMVLGHDRANQLTDNQVHMGLLLSSCFTGAGVFTANLNYFEWMFLINVSLIALVHCKWGSKSVIAPIADVEDMPAWQSTAEEQKVTSIRDRFSALPALERDIAALMADQFFGETSAKRCSLLLADTLDTLCSRFSLADILSGQFDTRINSILADLHAGVEQAKRELAAAKQRAYEREITLLGAETTRIKNTLASIRAMQEGVCHTEC